MKTTNFDAVLAGVPVNKAAATALSESKDNFEFSKGTSARQTFDLPPPITDEYRRYQLLDLRGIRFGKLVVVGLARDQNQKKKSSWVVRCGCGKYEFRKARAIRNPGNATDCCTQCRSLALARQAETARMYGQKKAAQSADAVRIEAIQAKASQPMPISRTERANLGKSPLPEWMVLVLSSNGDCK